MNILFLLNQEFIEMADEILSPVQMYISRNDGMCNADFIHSRDTIINANAMKNLYEYTPEEIAQIKGISYEEVLAITTANAKKMYKIQ